MLRATVGQIITIHRRQHDVLELHELDAARGVLRFLGVEPASRIAGVYAAKTAGPRAHRAHQHDGGSARVPAFTDVRTLGFFANRRETVLGHDAFHRAEAGTHRQLRADPGRLAPRCRAARASLLLT